MRSTACIADPPSFNQSAEGARPVHAIRSVRAQFGHTACMGLSLSRVVHAILSLPCLFHSFVRPAPRAFFRPDRIFAIAVARSGGQGRRFFSAAEGLSLTDASTAAGCRRSGGWPRDDPRGACHWPRAIAREPRLYSVEPCRVPTMKQSYASASKAPRRRVHSPSGIAAIAVCGLPPPRIVIGYPGASSAVRYRTLFVLSRYRVLLTPPAAARHRPAPRRS